MNRAIPVGRGIEVYLDHEHGEAILQWYYRIADDEPHAEDVVRRACFHASMHGLKMEPWYHTLQDALRRPK